MEKPREGEKLSTDYNQLLKQIQNLSELQSNGTIQNADPSIQVTKQDHNNLMMFSFLISGCLCGQIAATSSSNQTIVETSEQQWRQPQLKWQLQRH